MPSSLHSPPSRAAGASLAAGLLLATGLTFPLLSASCSAGSAGGFGPGSSQGNMEGSEALEFDQDADAVWRHTKETLAHLSTRVPRFDDETRSAFATVDGGSIRVEIAEVAPGRSRLTVKARRYGDESRPLAQSVLTRIGEEVER